MTAVLHDKGASTSTHHDAAAGHGHVNIVHGSLVPPTPHGRRNDWDRMHVILAAWKARRLLAEAQTHLCQAVADQSGLDHEFVAEFDAALTATAAAIRALRDVGPAPMPTSQWRKV